jgi:hypothetical protein
VALPVSKVLDNIVRLLPLKKPEISFNKGATGPRTRRSHRLALETASSAIEFQAIRVHLRTSSAVQPGDASSGGPRVCKLPLELALHILQSRELQPASAAVAPGEGAHVIRLAANHGAPDDRISSASSGSASLSLLPTSGDRVGEPAPSVLLSSEPVPAPPGPLSVVVVEVAAHAGGALERLLRAAAALPGVSSRSWLVNPPLPLAPRVLISDILDAAAAAETCGSNQNNFSPQVTAGLAAFPGVLTAPGRPVLPWSKELQILVLSIVSTLSRAAAQGILLRPCPWTVAIDFSSFPLMTESHGDSVRCSSLNASSGMTLYRGSSAWDVPATLTSAAAVACSGVYSCGLILLALFSGTHKIVVSAELNSVSRVLLPASLPSPLAGIVQHATVIGLKSSSFAGMHKSLEGLDFPALARVPCIAEAAVMLTRRISNEKKKSLGHQSASECRLYDGAEAGFKLVDGVMYGRGLVPACGERRISSLFSPLPGAVLDGTTWYRVEICGQPRVLRFWLMLVRSHEVSLCIAQVRATMEMNA